MIADDEEICLNARYRWAVPDPPGNVRIVREILDEHDPFLRRGFLMWPQGVRTFVVEDVPATGGGEMHAFADELTRIRPR